MIDLNEFARIGLGPSFFFRLAKNQFEIYLDIKKELNKICGGDKQLIYEHSVLDQKQTEAGVSVVVFAAICLEALIYDYGAINLSDTFIKKYVDKLDLRSKWVIIPKLVTGQDFPIDRQGFQLLGELITSRNSLVHPKTKDYKANKDKDFEEDDRAFKNTVEISLLAIKLLANDLSEIDPDSYELRCFMTG